MKKVLITGITGFAGSYLSDYLLKQNNYRVSGTYLNDESLLNLENKDSINLYKVDLLDPEATNKLVQYEKPDYLFHLAALTSAKKSFSSPRETFVNNVSGQINLLESIVKSGFQDTKILVVSSAEVYGLVSKEDLPIDEETPFMPTNPYSVSKLSQDFLGLQYFLSHKLNIVRVRPFNHVGPRQSPHFVVSAFAKRIVEIEKGKEAVMKVGNLESKRDFTDVRDMVKAYGLILEKGDIGEVYNIGTGKAYKISDILDILLHMSTTQIDVKIDETLLRPSDTPELLCDNTKFVSKTGWRAEYSIEETLQTILDYWRKIV
jgi:GDP-4-dehydro-6-deoxy-D-mannose reductase